MFNSNLASQNPIRELGEWADRLLLDFENSNNISCRESLLALQLGNPRFNQANEIAQHIIAEINLRPKNFGYEPHSGSSQLRRMLARIVQQLYATEHNALNIKPQNLILTNGATLGINASFAIASSATEDSVILLSKPGYPPYKAIARLHGFNYEFYELTKNNDFIPSFDQLYSQITTKDPKRVKIIVFNYPHNPTGATLNYEMAENLANTINLISKKFPWIIFIEEALYYATLHPEQELWTSYSLLNQASRDRTIIVGSGSKIGLASERAGFVYSECNLMAKHLASYVSLNSAGTGYLAQTGLLKAFELLGLSPGTKANTSEYREYLANFFETRRELVRKHINQIANAMDLEINDLICLNQQGGMYVWADFRKLFEGKNIPERISDYLKLDNKIHSAKDLQLVLLHLPLIDKKPILIPTGDIFDAESDYFIRISCGNSELDCYEQFFSSIQAIRLSSR